MYPKEASFRIPKRPDQPCTPLALPPTPAAKQAHGKLLPALCVDGCGAASADIGQWRTATSNLAHRTGPPVRHFGENQ